MNSCRGCSAGRVRPSWATTRRSRRCCWPSTTNGRTEELFDKNFKDVLDQLAERHKFALSENDWQTMRFVYRAFFERGPGLTYEGGQVRMTVGSGRNGVGDFNLITSVFPSYAELMMQTDGPARTTPISRIRIDTRRCATSRSATRSSRSSATSPATRRSAPLGSSSSSDRRRAR